MRKGGRERRRGHGLREKYREEWKGKKNEPGIEGKAWGRVEEKEEGGRVEGKGWEERGRERRGSQGLE